MDWSTNPFMQDNSDLLDRQMHYGILLQQWVFVDKSLKKPPFPFPDRVKIRFPRRPLIELPLVRKCSSLPLFAAKNLLRPGPVFPHIYVFQSSKPTLF